MTSATLSTLLPARGEPRISARVGQRKHTGTLVAPRVLLEMTLTSLAGGGTVRMTAKVFTKLLYLARSQGWGLERLPEGWPNSSWETEIILQETDPYRETLVSKVDAHGLSEALTKLATMEGAALDFELRTAMYQFIHILGRSAFLATEQGKGDMVMFAR
jgi:hypothetical protein